jgi:tetratricopeptide (TPR) repeat protein
MKLLSLAEEEEERNPSPEVQLLNQADMLESQGEWAAAETVRRQILARAELSDNFGWMVRTQGDLSRHLRTVGRLDEAWELAVAAVASSRHFTKAVMLRVMALTNEVQCALDRGDSDQALASAVEALALVEPGKLHDQARARALTNRARCRLACGDLVGAGLDLAAGWELLRKDPRFCNLPGPLWALGNWWEVKSQLETRLGDRASAREALTQAIEYRRQNEGAYELVALAHALGRLGKLLRAEGDEVGEERCLSEASSILEALNLPVATSRAWNFEADDITHGKQYYPRAE